LKLYKLLVGIVERVMLEPPASPLVIGVALVLG
jgi:hypothetical protein